MLMTPPTDSLYKFLAILGLVLAAWAVSFPWKQAYEYELKVAELKCAELQRNIKVEKINTTLDGLKVERARLEKVNDSEAELKIAAVDKRKQQLYIDKLEAQQPVDEKVEVLKVLSRAQTTYQHVAYAGTSLGVVLSFVGFICWYFRIQRHIDADVLKEGSLKKRGSSDEGSSDKSDTSEKEGSSEDDFSEQ